MKGGVGKSLVATNLAVLRSKYGKKVLLVDADELGLRKAFSNATAEGLGVIELKSDRKAVEEITALHDAIFDRKKMSSKNK